MPTFKSHVSCVCEVRRTSLKAHVSCVSTAVSREPKLSPQEVGEHSSIHHGMGRSHFPYHTDKAKPSQVIIPRSCKGTSAHAHKLGTVVCQKTFTLAAYFCERRADWEVRRFYSLVLREVPGAVLCSCAQGEGTFLHIALYAALLIPRIGTQPFLAN